MPVCSTNERNLVIRISIDFLSSVSSCPDTRIDRWSRNIHLQSNACAMNLTLESISSLEIEPKWSKAKNLPVPTVLSNHLSNSS